MRYRLATAFAIALGCGFLLAADTVDGRNVTEGVAGSAVQHHCNLSSANNAQSGGIHMGGSTNSYLTVYGHFTFSPIFWAYTTGGCKTARIEMWLQGIGDDEKVCGSGWMDNGACNQIDGFDGPGFRNASAEQHAEFAELKYGRHSSYANRFIIDHDGGWWPHASWTAQIDLGRSPREECESQNHYWDEGNQTCEINPDGPNGSPIIIPVGKKVKYKLTSVGDGVRFDLDNDGLPERVSWTRPDSEFAFLAIDRNGDGQITNGSELFGDRTLGDTPLNGFLALERLLPQDPNGDLAVIEEGDPVYERLLLWTDSNHNGKSEPHELRPARELLSRIGVGYTKEPGNVDKHGNIFLYSGWAERRTGPGKNRAQTAKEHKNRLIKIYDVFLYMVNVA